MDIKLNRWGIKATLLHKNNDQMTLFAVLTYEFQHKIRESKAKQKKISLLKNRKDLEWENIKSYG